jgi:hypothetical protein
MMRIKRAAYTRKIKIREMNTDFLKVEVLNLPLLIALYSLCPLVVNGLLMPVYSSFYSSE